MITTSLRVPSSIERIMVDTIMDSIVCMGDDALRIQIVDSKFTGQVDADRNALQMLTLMGTAYDIERLIDFVESELVCNVFVCKEEMSQLEDKTHAIFQIVRRNKPQSKNALKRDEEFDWRSYNKMKRYRCYQKIQKENELRATDHRVIKLWERKIVSDVLYYEYQSFPENAKVFLYKYISSSDEHFLNQLLMVQRILNKENDSQQDSDQEENQSEDEN